MDALMMKPATEYAALAELNQKLDHLSAQVAVLAEEAYQQRRRREEWTDLQNDLTPVALDAYRVMVNQLEEVEPHVQLEDLLRLFKRLLRNTRNLEQMLDQFESVAELASDVGPLSQNAFLTLMTRLDALERKGYFTFAAGTMEIADRIVDHFSADDLAQLGDNIVLILETVKQMTQPDIMRLLSHTAEVVREEEAADPPSLLQLIRQLNDPAVRRGLAKTLNVVKSVSN